MNLEYIDDVVKQAVFGVLTEKMYYRSENVCKFISDNLTELDIDTVRMIEGRIKFFMNQPAVMIHPLPRVKVKELDQMWEDLQKSCNTLIYSLRSLKSLRKEKEDYHDFIKSTIDNIGRYEKCQKK